MAITGSLSFGSAEIQVEPDRLVSAANAVLNRTEMMSRNFESIKTYMEKTKGYWKGEAGDLHRSLYAKQQDTVDAIIQTLKERVSELEMMAQNYTSGESSASQTAEQLPVDVIQW